MPAQGAKSTRDFLSLPLHPSHPITGPTCWRHAWTKWKRLWTTTWTTSTEMLWSMTMYETRQQLFRARVVSWVSKRLFLRPLAEEKGSLYSCFSVWQTCLASVCHVARNGRDRSKDDARAQWNRNSGLRNRNWMHGWVRSVTTPTELKGGTCPCVC